MPSPCPTCGNTNPDTRRECCFVDSHTATVMMERATMTAEARTPKQIADAIVFDDDFTMRGTWLVDAIAQAIENERQTIRRLADDLAAIEGAAKDAHHHFIRYEPDRGEWWGKNHDGVWAFAETFADACRAATKD